MNTVLSAKKWKDCDGGTVWFVTYTIDDGCRQDFCFWRDFEDAMVKYDISSAEWIDFWDEELLFDVRQYIAANA